MAYVYLSPTKDTKPYDTCNIIERPIYLPISGNMSPLLNLCPSPAYPHPQVSLRAKSATLPIHSAMSTAPL